MYAFVPIQQLFEVSDVFGWTFGVKWSPTGSVLAYVGKNVAYHLAF